jgi:drug/metabolite transporter (DMT)-like permease
MTVPPWLWVVFTLAAATAQTFRNATQRSLTDTLGTVGATHVRFLFGLPFGLIAVVVVGIFVGGLPVPTLAVALWASLGAVCQIAATALMLAAMRERSFVVTIAYTKTEPVQIAVFAVVFLGETVSLPLAVAIVVATVGVLLLSWPARSGDEVFSWRPALFGMASGGLFALAAVGFRGAIVSFADAGFIQAATITVAMSLSIQTMLLTGWLAVRDPAVLRAIVVEWRPSLAAGFLGALASEFWFLAFAIKGPAAVRTLGLVEVLIAGMVSRGLFRQTPGVRDVAGMILLVAGVALLLGG